MQFTIMSVLSTLLIATASGVVIAEPPPGHPSNPKFESAYSSTPVVLTEQGPFPNQGDMRRVETLQPPAPPSDLRIQEDENLRERPGEDNMHHQKEAQP